MERDQMKCADLLKSVPVIWNPDHLDKNWQNSTYVSEHDTDIYVHVHTVS
jgi:hypothetical protein